MNPLCVIATAYLVLITGCSESPAPPKNVLLITVDTLRADHLGLYGYPRGTSPALDDFLADAVVFDDAQSSSSWTLPAFASLFTSLHTSGHGCFGYRSRLDPSFQTLAETLVEHGYRTAGVVSHVFLREKHGLPQGFQEFDDSFVETPQEAHSAISSPYVTDRGVAHLEAFASSTESAPWLLWLHYFDPHVSYRRHDGVSGRFGARTPLDRYDGEIAFTDQHVGVVLDRLEQLGLAEETVVAFVSDHGEEFGEHGRAGHGKSLFEEVLHVPFVLRVPGLAPRRVPETVHLVDFAPTLLDLVDIPWPASEPRHGRTLLPALRGERLPDVGSLSELDLGLRKDATLASLVFGRWKLIEERARPPATGVRARLYDRRSDRGELHDVAEQHEDVVQRMTERLHEVERRAARTRRRRLELDTELSRKELEDLKALGYVAPSDEDE